MIPRIHAPFRNLAGQRKRQFPVVRNPDRSLAAAAAGLIQPFREVFDGLRAGIQSDMLFLCRKMNDIMSLPISRHGPGDPFFRVGQLALQHRSDALKGIPDAFLLRKNIFVHGLRRFSAEMVLADVFEGSSTFAVKLFRGNYILPAAGCKESRGFGCTGLTRALKQRELLF